MTERCYSCGVTNQRWRGGEGEGDHSYVLQSVSQANGGMGRPRQNIPLQPALEPRCELPHEECFGENNLRGSVYHLENRKVSEERGLHDNCSSSVRNGRQVIAGERAE